MVRGTSFVSSHLIQNRLGNTVQADALYGFFYQMVLVSSLVITYALNSMTTIKQHIKNDSRLVFTNRLLKAYPKCRVYVVGGAVRDWLIGRQTKDIDIVVTGLPPKKLEEYLRKIGRVDLVGKVFGVYKVVPRGQSGTEPIDVALPRTEHSMHMTGGYRDFKVQSDYRLPIERDLERRDFTVNALAWDIAGERLIDPTSGLADLATKKIRAVGAPAQRFQEDYSRLLRALRFSVQLGFTIDSATWSALKRFMPKVNSPTVPKETVAKEMIKAFVAQPVQAFDLYDSSGAFKVLIPELLKMKGCRHDPEYHSEGDVWTHTRLALEMLAAPKFNQEFPGVDTLHPELVLATLLHDVGKSYTAKKLPKGRRSFYGHEVVGSRIASDICTRLKLSSYLGLITCDRLGWLIRSHMVVLHGQPNQMRPTTLERYFILPPERGQRLLQMLYADGAASRSIKGRPSLQRYRATVRVIQRIKKSGYGRTGAPKLLLNGTEIMRALKWRPGPAVGRLLEDLRLRQLRGQITTKAQARNYLIKLYGQT
jgi:tRNA nucleotidyltransferase/poly(A) polymerase